MKDKRAKRWRREHGLARRAMKRETWLCDCGARHPKNQRCPIPRGNPYYPTVSDILPLVSIGGER